MGSNGAGRPVKVPIGGGMLSCSLVSCSLTAPQRRDSIALSRGMAKSFHSQCRTWTRESLAMAMRMRGSVCVLGVSMPLIRCISTPFRLHRRFVSRLALAIAMVARRRSCLPHGVPHNLFVRSVLLFMTDGTCLQAMLLWMTCSRAFACMRSAMDWVLWITYWKILLHYVVGSCRRMLLVMLVRNLSRRVICGGLTRRELSFVLTCFVTGGSAQGRLVALSQAPDLARVVLQQVRCR